MILVFLAILFILKFNDPAPFTDYLIGLVLLLCIASAAFAVWVSRNIDMEVSTHMRSLNAGDSINVSVKITHPDFYGKLRAVVKLSNLQRKESAVEKRVITENVTELCFSGLSTGTIEVKIPYVEVFGIFGIFRIRRRTGFKTRVNVYPCEGPSPDKYVRVSYIHGGGEIQNVKGDDYSEIFEVRPIQEGDDLRHVHRQLSAKYDEYIIKVGSDSRRQVFNYYLEDGLPFPEMSVRIAQMVTLRKSLDKEEDALMAAAYKGRFYVIAVDSQLYDLADRIYEEYLPKEPKYKGAKR